MKRFKDWIPPLVVFILFLGISGSYFIYDGYQKYDLRQFVYSQWERAGVSRSAFERLEIYKTDREGEDKYMAAVKMKTGDTTTFYYRDTQLSPEGNLRPVHSTTVEGTYYY